MTPTKLLAIGIAFTPGFALFLAFVFLPRRWLGVAWFLLLLGIALAIMLLSGPDDPMNIDNAIAILLLKQLAAATVLSWIVRLWVGRTRHRR